MRPLESIYMDIVGKTPSGEETILEGTRFVRACLRKPVDRTPVWFLRQAGRYMQEYRDVRKHHTLVEICKQPELAAEVTITAAEKAGRGRSDHFCRSAAAARTDGACHLNFKRVKARWCTSRCARLRT